jgi:hypothetical protein
VVHILTTGIYRIQDKTEVQKLLECLAMWYRRFRKSIHAVGDEQFSAGTRKYYKRSHYTPDKRVNGADIVKFHITEV